MKKLKSIYSIIILLVLIAFTVGAIFITDRSTASESSIVTTDFIAVTTTVNENSDGIIDTSDLFTDRDLTQNADLNGAIYHTVSDGQDFTIHADGVYVISGTASNASIIINAPSTAKIQLVLDDLHITNDSSAAIIVREAKKVFVTTASDSSLSVSGDFEAYDGINVDAVIFSKADLILNGDPEAYLRQVTDYHPLDT